MSAPWTIESATVYSALLDIDRVAVHSLLNLVLDEWFGCITCDLGVWGLNPACSLCALLQTVDRNPRSTWVGSKKRMCLRKAG